MCETFMPAKGTVMEFQRPLVVVGQPPGYGGESPQAAVTVGGSHVWIDVPPHALSTSPRGTPGPSASARKRPVNQHVAEKCATAGPATDHGIAGAYSSAGKGVAEPREDVPTENTRTHGKRVAPATSCVPLKAYSTGVLPPDKFDCTREGSW